MVDVSDDVTVKEYFEEYVPRIFAEQLEKIMVIGMEDTLAKLTFNVVGDSRHTYTLVVKDSKDLEVVPGPIDDSLLCLEMSEDTWREAVTGKLSGAVDMFTDMGQMANRARYDKVKEIKGTLNLDLSRADGPNVEIKVTFNGAESPSATFICSLEDWVAMSKGELSGVTAFMGGKLKIDGDMPLAIELSSLTT